MTIYKCSTCKIGIIEIQEGIWVNAEPQTATVKVSSQNWREPTSVGYHVKGEGQILAQRQVWVQHFHE